VFYRKKTCYDYYTPEGLDELRHFRVLFGDYSFMLGLIHIPIF